MEEGGAVVKVEEKGDTWRRNADEGSGGGENG